MSLTLYFHPFASYCHKALIALYEHDIPFTGHVVDLLDEAARTAYLRLWPLGKMPVLRDAARDRTVGEATIVVEYLDAHYRGSRRLVPEDIEHAREVRFLDRLFDLYVNDPMSKIVTDNLRPPGRNDPHGVEQARQTLRTAYAVVEARMATRTWAAGDAFTLADCAAAPALFYANLVEPFEATHPRTAAYLGRLIRRPSFARVLTEREPYVHLFPA